MKKCPNCQNTFDDDKRFCQVDGTPLVEMVESPPQSEDPFKTVVVGKQDLPLGNISEDPMKTTVISADSKDDDILQIPEVFDPMKTMVVSEPIKFDKPVAKPVADEPPVSAPELPKFSEPDLSPPNFGDLGAKETSKTETPKTESPIANPFNEPPKFNAPIANPFSEPPKFESPFSTPTNEPPKPFEPTKFDSNPLPSESSPIQSPFEKKEPPPFKVPEPVFNPPPSPFDPTPFGQNEPINQPLQQAEWNPPSPPVQQEWQGSGSQMSAQQPIADSAGQNKTLGMVSLILGVASFICSLSFLGAIPAVILGYMQKNKIKSDPMQYGGGGLATAGMILGIANIILSIIGLIILILFWGSLIASM